MCLYELMIIKKNIVCVPFVFLHSNGINVRISALRSERF